MAKHTMPAPKKGGKPKKISTKNKPGSTGPWGANPAAASKPKKLKR